MVTSHPARSRVQRVLDPTKIGTLKVVRRPPVERGQVIQGRPREANSNAAKEFQAQESERLRKALNRLTHGKNIFVYNNLRTNQVVYSLTRYLEKNNVLSQLIYHGKKTVPATLRKDMWAPYYSVHFNDSKVGLRAFHLLREFSKLRQLSPPREMITITEQFIEQKKPRAPEEAKKFEEEYGNKIGWMMDKKHRARVLMDQKATSVADIAAVLAIQEEEIKNGFAEGKRGPITRTARRRRRAAREKEKKVEEEAVARVEEFAKFLTQNSESEDFKIQDPSGNGEYKLGENEVKILWADLHDAHFAAAWPERVRHGELELVTTHLMPGQKDVQGDYESEIVTEDSFTEKQGTVSATS